MIACARLTLRPPKASDIEDLHRILSNPQAMRYWDRPAFSKADSQSFLDRWLQADPAVSFDLIIEKDGSAIGKAGVWQCPEVGYFLHPDYWGQSLMYEALSAVLPACFKRFPETPALKAEVDPRNLASLGLLEKLGFARTGYAEKNFLYGESEWCDTVYYELPRPEPKSATSLA